MTSASIPIEAEISKTTITIPAKTPRARSRTVAATRVDLGESYDGIHALARSAADAKATFAQIATGFLSATRRPEYIAFGDVAAVLYVTPGCSESPAPQFEYRFISASGSSSTCSTSGGTYEQFKTRVKRHLAEAGADRNVDEQVRSAIEFLGSLSDEIQSFVRGAAWQRASRFAIDNLPEVDYHRWAGEHQDDDDFLKPVQAIADAVAEERLAKHCR